jgi:hypothetical protein
MERVMEDPDFALFGEAMSQKSFEHYKTCKFIAIPGKYGNYPSGYILPKNSSIGPIFRYYIKRLIESGSVDQIKLVYQKTYEDQACPNYRGKPIGHNKTFSLFGMYITAAMFSLMLLV